MFQQIVTLGKFKIVLLVELIVTSDACFNLRALKKNTISLFFLDVLTPMYIPYGQGLCINDLMSPALSMHSVHKWYSINVCQKDKKDLREQNIRLHISHLRLQN